MVCRVVITLIPHAGRMSCLQAEARMLVLGDTAYDADVVREACADRGYELAYLADRLETTGGIRKLKRLLRAGFAPEYRAAL